MVQEERVTETAAFEGEAKIVKVRREIVYAINCFRLREHSVSGTILFFICAT